MFEIALTYIYCQEDSDEAFNDEPYVIAFAVDLADALTVFNFGQATMYGPFHRMSNSFVPGGSVRGRPVTPVPCWFDGNARDIDDPDNVVLIVALLESDNDVHFSEQVRQGVDGFVGLIAEPLVNQFATGGISRSALIDQLKAHVRDFVDTLRRTTVYATPEGPKESDDADERLGPVLQLVVTREDLERAATENVKKKMTFTSRREESEYDLTFTLGSGVGSVSQELGASGPSDRYAAIWLQEEGGRWAARHGLDDAGYQDAFDQHGREGYRLTHVGGYNAGGASRYVAIWEEGQGGAWVAAHGMTVSRYQMWFNEQVAAGFRPTRVSGYRGRGQDLYAAIFEKNDGRRWAARHRMTSNEFQLEFQRMSDLGLRLVDVSGYHIGQQPRYAALWEEREGPSWAARHGMNSAQYQKTFDEYARDGYQLVHVSCYRVNAQPLYAAIWEQASGVAWRAAHGLTADEYQTRFEQLANEGFRLVCASGC